jgi:hypothetical protein
MSFFVFFYQKNLFENKYYFYLCAAFELWPVRLGVRTPDFHSGSTGSIPVRATKKGTSIEVPFLFSEGWIRRKSQFLQNEKRIRSLRFHRYLNRVLHFLQYFSQILHELFREQLLQGLWSRLAF